ncbi:hypothetical protein R1sor_015417 [Riccia sorocarpa]|uniref:Reverse transcriptase n=1 Tax=Riccia sorocarpa TaxID=122646 RepID=A0ABD3HCL6_9MARC
MARRGSRYDCSRLDRLYLSSGASWIDHVRDIHHHSAKTVSDHVPVTVTLQIRLEGLVPCERDAKATPKREEGSLEAEVAWRRQMLSEDPSAEEIETLESLEKRLKARELEDAKSWKVRSRVKWLSVEEAPSRYFFAKLRANWAKESLNALETEDGTVSTDTEEILQEIHSFYQILYTAEEESEEWSQAHDEVIGLVSKSIPEDASIQVAKMPDRAEIERVVFNMKSGKAPGQDGLTANMVKCCWEFVRDCCIKLVQAKEG